MKAKAAPLLLLLALVSVQTLTADCDVRCATMEVSNSASDNSAGEMSGMAHCHGMASQPVSAHPAAATLTAHQPCASHICTDDWTFVQSAHEVGGSILSMAQLSQNPISIGVASLTHSDADQSTHAIPPLEPLLINTSLRV